MIQIVDYGAGNLFSVQNALNYLQIENKVTADPAELDKADGIILPGVGAFRDAMQMLNRSGFTEAIKEQAAQGKPLPVSYTHLDVYKRQEQSHGAMCCRLLREKYAPQMTPPFILTKSV